MTSANAFNLDQYENLSFGERLSTNPGTRCERENIIIASLLPFSEKIHHYFGDKIGLYFAFLGFYTVALIPPAFIGIIYWVTSWESMYREVIFAVFNLVWATIFLEAWKRYCAELAFKWGSIDIIPAQFEEPRANYHGHMGKNPVTGKPEPVFPKTQRLLRFYGVTVPVLFLCLTVAFYAMLGYFWLQAIVDKWYADDKGWLMLLNTLMPTVIYAIVIAILNAIYRKVATLLNDFGMYPDLPSVLLSFFIVLLPGHKFSLYCKTKNLTAPNLKPMQRTKLTQ